MSRKLGDVYMTSVCWMHDPFMNCSDRMERLSEVHLCLSQCQPIPVFIACLFICCVTDSVTVLSHPATRFPAVNIPTFPNHPASSVCLQTCVHRPTFIHFFKITPLNLRVTRLGTSAKTQNYTKHYNYQRVLNLHLNPLSLAHMWHQMGHKGKHIIS